MATLPPALHNAYIHGYAASIQMVFLVAAPIGGVAFLLTWLLPEIELRGAPSKVNDIGEGFGMAEDRTSLQEVQRKIEMLAGREERIAMYQRLIARTGAHLTPREAWLLFRVRDHETASLQELAKVVHLSIGQLEGLAVGLVEHGLLVDDIREPDGRCLTLTARGSALSEQLVAARRDGLANLLGGWSPDDHPEVAELLRELATQLLADDNRMIEDSRSSDAEAASAR